MPVQDQASIITYQLVLTGSNAVCKEILASEIMELSLKEVHNDSVTETNGRVKAGLGTKNE